MQNKQNIFNFKKISDKITRAACLNDIQDVIDGKRPENAEKLWTDAGNYSHGFGNGSVTDVNALGESVIFNGMAYTKSTDKSSPNYYQLSAGQKFMTSWIFLLPKNPTAQWLVTHEQANPQSSNSSETLAITDIYQAIYEQIKKPFIVAGIVNFTRMKGAAIAKAPIENQNIFEHKDIYYPEKNQMEKENVCSGIFGVAAEISAITDESLSHAIKKVVYYSPLDSGKTALTTHEHVLILNKKIKTIEEVTLEDAADVEHLFTDSTVQSFCLNIYEIEPGSIALR